MEVQAQHGYDCVCFRPDKLTTGGSGDAATAELIEAHNGHCPCGSISVTNTRAHVEAMLNFCIQFDRDMNSCLCVSATTLTGANASDLIAGGTVYL